MFHTTYRYCRRGDVVPMVLPPHVGRGGPSPVRSPLRIAYGPCHPDDYERFDELRRWSKSRREWFFQVTRQPMGGGREQIVARASYEKMFGCVLKSAEAIAGFNAYEKGAASMLMLKRSSLARFPFRAVTAERGVIHLIPRVLSELNVESVVVQAQNLHAEPAKGFGQLHA